MPKIRFDKFYRYDELTRLLKALCKGVPESHPVGVDREKPRRARCLADNGDGIQVGGRCGEACLLGGWQYARLRSDWLRRRVISDPFIGDKIQSG